MKISLTGWNGFLSSKLRENMKEDWVENSLDAECLILMGSPIFTQAELTQHDAQVIHQYVRETVRMVDRFDGYLVFASTTGVNDIQLNHLGSTSYNLAKLYLENYIINHSDNYSILRIGTIISNHLTDVENMKGDRIQPRIMRKDYKNIPMFDYYLNVNTFIDTTVDVIKNKKTGIIEYELEYLSIPKLREMIK